MNLLSPFDRVALQMPVPVETPSSHCHASHPTDSERDRNNTLSREKGEKGPLSAEEKISSVLKGALCIPLSFLAQKGAVDFGIGMGWTTQAASDYTYGGACHIPSLSQGQIWVREIPGLPLAAVEEYLFRVVLQKRILRDKAIQYFPELKPWIDSAAGKTARVFITSVVFAACHLCNTHIQWDVRAVQALNAFGLGISTGYLMEKTGKPYAGIGLHVGWNIVGIWLGSRKC